MDSMLHVEALEKSYADFRLDNISFDLPEGYIMGLIGPNGSGKTTTIKAILNMTEREGGKITVFGKDNIASEQEIKKDIGAVFDSSSFVDEWTMADVEKAYTLFYPAWDSEKYWSLLSRFRIGKTKKVKELSKGMQMKLMLACAFSYDARLLILDEPTSGLDPVSRDELLDILCEYIEDGRRSVLFSTHITPDLEKIADYITYIHLGQLIFTGTKEDFADSFRVVRGDRKELTPRLEARLIGLRTFPTGFEALIRKEDLAAAGLLECVPASIDDIVVFMSRQTDRNSQEENI